MKIRKLFIISVVMMVFLVLLGSGCGTPSIDPIIEEMEMEVPGEAVVETVEVEMEKIVEVPAAEAPMAAAPAAGPVALTWYLGGDSPTDEARVETILNSLPQMQEAGIQVDLVFIPWDVYPTVLRDTIAVGGNCDLAFVSEQANDYQALASEGFLMPVNDLVNNYAPDIFMQIPKEVWDLAGVNGKIYAVPHLTAWSAPQGIMIDKAMLDK